MTKRKLLPRALLAALVFALPAAADAPRDPPQYERFTGDSLTIEDAFTKLQWDRRNVLRGASKSVAGAGCATLSTLQGTGRLPTVKELLTILDEDPHPEYEFGDTVLKMIDALAFADTPVDRPFWTSTPAGGSKYWTVDFSTGAMEALDEASTANARCVR